MQEEEKVSTVVTSQAMVAPAVDKVLCHVPDPVQAVPPAVHARIHGCASAGEYALQYNGVDLLTFRFPEAVKPSLRFHSDGDFQSEPFIQQFVTFAPEGTLLSLKISAPVEWWNIRPERAKRGEAILGQLGAPLLYGVNGIYLPDWDLLVSLHGAFIQWRGDSVIEKDGCFTAEADMTLGDMPLVVLLRPRYYSEHLGYRSHRPWHRRPKPDAICGWCSWEAYHDAVTLENVRDAAEALAPLKSYGLSLMQLDDGYQQTTVPLHPGADVGESWLNPNDKFPGGHVAIVEAMAGNGFTPGIWLNATLTDHDNAESIGCCLKDGNGELIKGDWIQYIMDCTPETLARHVTQCYCDLREAGYRYFKADSIRHLIYDGLQEAVRRGLMTTEEARERHTAYMRAAREGMGEDAYFLSCWGVLSSSIGICDAMRVATDANPTWRAFSMQLRETARWYFAQRVLFTVDPDHVCVRAPIEWVRMMLSNVSLTGGLMMVSDPPATYDAPRMELMRRTMPPLPVHTGETGSIDYSTPACAFGPKDMDKERTSFFIAHERPGEAYPFASLWATHLRKGGRAWCVIQRSAVTPLPELVVGLEAFSLDPNETYYAYNFWTGEAWKLNHSIQMKALELGDTQVIALTRIRNGVPDLIGSNRHVSCDAVSVERVDTTEQGIALWLTGFEGMEATYTIYAPEMMNSVQADGAKANLERSGELLRVLVRLKKEKAKIVIE